jgi:hypothetical protein
MNRKVTLKIVLALVGLLFLALTYPLIIFARQVPSLSMMFSLCVTLGVFLLLAIRDPWANRSLIAFTAWSSFAHAAVMGTQAMRNMVASGEMVGGGGPHRCRPGLDRARPSQAACSRSTLVIDEIDGVSLPFESQRGRTLCYLM